MRGEWSHLSFTTRNNPGLVYLSTVGAIGGLVAYNYALRHLPVSFVSLYAYINPVIAVRWASCCCTSRSTRAWRWPPRSCSAASRLFDGAAVRRWRAVPRGAGELSRGAVDE